MTSEYATACSKKNILVRRSLGHADGRAPLSFHLAQQLVVAANPLTTICFHDTRSISAGFRHSGSHMKTTKWLPSKAGEPQTFQIGVQNTTESRGLLFEMRDAQSSRFLIPSQKPHTVCAVRRTSYGTFSQSQQKNSAKQGPQNIGHGSPCRVWSAPSCFGWC